MEDVLLLSCVVAVITAVPLDFAVTKPVVPTVATDGALLVHEMIWVVELVG